MPPLRVVQVEPGEGRRELLQHRHELPARDGVARLVVTRVLVGIHHDLDGARFVPASSCTAEGFAAWFGERLAEPGAALLVAVWNAQVLGYVYGAVEGDDWTALRGPAGVLHDLVVDPAHRGPGVGRPLLEAAVAALGARGVPQVVLSTAARNTAAQRLFAHAGFRPTMVEMTRALEDGSSTEAPR